MSDRGDTLLDFSAYAYVDGCPSTTAVIRERLEDFQVDELTGFEFSDRGDHLCLRIRKRDVSTVDVARHLSRALNVRPADVGYSGMKDRRGVCTQWFSVPAVRIGARDMLRVNDASVEVLETRANDRKLRIGSHRANAFRICLRKFRGDVGELEARFRRAQENGVPNYFGPQRFGREMTNVRQAQEFFRGFDLSDRAPRIDRFRKGLLLSASRSYLFNAILSRRVRERSWNRALEGEVFNLDGTKRFFKPREDEARAEQDERDIPSRLATLDIHPTGLLAGANRSGDRYLAEAQVRALENETIGQYQELVLGLEKVGVESSRRALRLVPQDCELIAGQGDAPILAFTLASGGYATTLLRELTAVDPACG